MRLALRPGRNVPIKRSLCVRSLVSIRLTDGLSCRRRSIWAAHHNCVRTVLSSQKSTFKSLSNVPHAVQHSDTIYALSSAVGRAAIAVIRVSGPACLDVSVQVWSSQRLANIRQTGL